MRSLSFYRETIVGMYNALSSARSFYRDATWLHNTYLCNPSIQWPFIINDSDPAWALLHAIHGYVTDTLIQSGAPKDVFKRIELQPIRYYGPQAKCERDADEAKATRAHWERSIGYL